MRKKQTLLILIIFLAAAFRLFRIDKVPSGLIPEEASTAWNAYTLSETGRDEWGNFLPVVFTETGGFKLALNSYLTAPAVKIFGLNEFSARFPTALSGVLAVILTYFLTFELLRRIDVALAASFLLAISPWHVSMSRYGVDVNWGIPIFLSGLWFFIKAQRNLKVLLLSGVFFALTYYTYFNYVVFTFIFIVLLILLHRKLFISKSAVVMLFIFIMIQGIFLLPYVSQKNLTIRFSQATSVEEVGFENKINEHRQACGVYYPQVLCQLLYNKPLEKFTQITRNLINHFSTANFFLYGSQLGLSGMPQNWGFFYLFEFPLIIFGLVLLIRRKIFPPVFLAWGILYGIPSSLAGEAHIWRMMTLLPLPQIIGAFGLIELGRYLRNNLFKIGMISVICFSLLKFTADYFAYFPYAQGSYSYFGFRDLYSYLAKVEKDYDQVVIAPVGMGFNQLYIYYLFYNKHDARSYQNAENIDRVVGEQNWVWVNRIGKWYFVSEPKKVTYPLSTNTLLVTDNIKPDEVIYDKNLKPILLHTIYHANGDTAFKIMKLSGK